jgi:hypothetical protein
MRMIFLSTKMATNTLKGLRASRSKSFLNTTFDIWHSCVGLSL